MVVFICMTDFCVSSSLFLLLLTENLFFYGASGDHFVGGVFFFQKMSGTVFSGSQHFRPVKQLYTKKKNMFVISLLAFDFLRSESCCGAPRSSLKARPLRHVDCPQPGMLLRAGRKNRSNFPMGKFYSSPRSGHYIVRL